MDALERWFTELMTNHKRTLSTILGVTLAFLTEIVAADWYKGQPPAIVSHLIYFMNWLMMLFGSVALGHARIKSYIAYKCEEKENGEIP